MKALVSTYASVRGIELRDLFRSAYLRAFQKDMPPHSLDEDLRIFNEQGVTPKYLINFLLSIIGTDRGTK